MKYKIIYGFTAFDFDTNQDKEFKVDETYKLEEKDGNLYYEGWEVPREYVEKVPFPWVQVGIGAGALIGVIVLFIVIRRR